MVVWKEGEGGVNGNRIVVGHGWWNVVTATAVLKDGGGKEEKGR
jgi:hypothetical protein